MKKNKLFIVEEYSRATFYGIGTYIKSLMCFLCETNFEVGIIYLNTKEKEVKRIINNKSDEIYLPTIDLKEEPLEKHQIVTASLLGILLSTEKEYKYTFHINYHTDLVLVQELKNYFDCKIIFTVHYTIWSLILYGNNNLLREILRKKEFQLTEDLEKTIYESFKKDKEMFEEVDKIIFVANHTYDVYKEHINFNKSKITIIHNALKDSYQEISVSEKKRLKSKYFIHSTTKIIVYAGRVDDIKGVPALIEAFKKVVSSYPDTKLIIAGEGDFSLYLKLAEDYWNKILFVGRVDRNKLYEFYNIADLGVVSSIHEEFGYVAIEMMMHKLPIIVSDTGGLAEIVEDGISGLKVPVIEENGKRKVIPERIAEKILYLLENPSFSTQLGINGRQTFLDKFESQHFNNKMYKLYSEFLLQRE